MPPALKAKQFGLPRWVWLIAIVGGVGVGLYIRARRAEQDSASATAVGDGTTDAGLADSVASDPLQYNGLDGLPLGYYAPTSGVADTGQDTGSVDAVDPATNDQPIINITMPDGSTKAGRIKGPPGKRGKPGKAGKPGKKGPAGPKSKVMGGGGPPKSPPKKAKPKPKAGGGFAGAGAGGGGGGGKKKKK